MVSQDDENRLLAHESYWNERYNEVKDDAQLHEWFKSYNDLSPFFDKHLFQVQGPEAAPKILHLGSGDSSIPQDLAKRGYNDQICVDFSSVIIERMSIRYQDVQGITWKEMDVRDMKGIESDSIDVAFDKGTLDAMIHGSPWSPPNEVRDNTSRYLREVWRVLKPGGRMLYVTYRQSYHIKRLLDSGGVACAWEIDVMTLGGDQGMFDYRGFTLTKPTGTVAAE